MPRGNLGEGQAKHGLNIHLLKTWEWWYEPLEEPLHNKAVYFLEAEFQFKHQLYNERSWKLLIFLGMKSLEIFCEIEVVKHVIEMRLHKGVGSIVWCLNYLSNI